MKREQSLNFIVVTSTGQAPPGAGQGTLAL